MIRDWIAINYVQIANHHPQITNHNSRILRGQTGELFLASRRRRLRGDTSNIPRSTGVRLSILVAGEQYGDSYVPGIQILDDAPPARVSISSLRRLTNPAGS